MVKKVLLISIVIIALAAGRASSAQLSRGSGQQPSQTPLGQGQPGGQDGAHKGGEKGETPRESEEDQTLVEKKQADERMRTIKNNSVLMMKGITEITQGLTKMMEKDMSPDAMTKIAPLLKDLAAEMTEIQNILSKGRASEDEMVTLRLRIDVTKKKMDQMK